MTYTYCCVFSFTSISNKERCPRRRYWTKKDNLSADPRWLGDCQDCVWSPRDSGPSRSVIPLGGKDLIRKKFQIIHIYQFHFFFCYLPIRRRIFFSYLLYDRRGFHYTNVIKAISNFDGSRNSINLNNLPLELGDTNSRLTKAAPVSWPSNVTRLGSPPNAAMLVLIQRRAAAMSLIPRLPPELSDLSKLGFVRRNPVT